MQERQAGQRPIEATYVTVAKDIVSRKIPEHQASFDIVLEEINKQITGEGLFLWESSDQPGVSFLAGRLSITPELIERISQGSNSPESSNPEHDPKERRLDKYIYFLQPSFGFGGEGNVFSILGYGVDRFIREMPKVARAMKAGEKPPEIAIYLLGSPGAFGGTVTQSYVDGVRKNGFSEQGRIYAEFVQEQLAGVDLDRSRIVIQGASKGAITSDKTFEQLPDEVKDRTQLLFDNPAGNHESGVLSRTVRSYNLGAGSALEISARRRFGLVRRGTLKGRKNFYDVIALVKNIPEDTQEQRRLKRRLFLTGDLWNLAKGTPLNPANRSYSRIPTIDSLYIDLPNLVRLTRASASGSLENEEGEGAAEAEGRKSLTAKQKGRRIIFSTANIGHKHSWARGVASGSWAQKMNYVEDSSTKA